eukprot:GHVT01008452.1.p2 GENE.GHVT01008452.1~~GHVT01008452.1.p2  ORF type:complete len:244 (-),score=19.91 GHVT01008452.1:686-1417(-)
MDSNAAWCGIPNFVAYDPTNIDTVPLDMRNAFDLVIADTPFLSRRSIEVFADIIRKIQKPDVITSNMENGEEPLTMDRLIICSAAHLEPVMFDILGVCKRRFRPKLPTIGSEEEHGCSLFTNSPSSLWDTVTALKPSPQDTSRPEQPRRFLRITRRDSDLGSNRLYPSAENLSDVRAEINNSAKEKEESSAQTANFKKPSAASPAVNGIVSRGNAVALPRSPENEVDWEVEYASNLGMVAVDL